MSEMLCKKCDCFITYITENTWLATTDNPIEINLGEENIKINIGTHSGYIEIDKLYGPHGGEDIRISLENYQWVIRRLNASTDIWEEKLRMPLQETYSKEEK